MSSAPASARSCAPVSGARLAPARVRAGASARSARAAPDRVAPLRGSVSCGAAAPKGSVTLLDYGAGNVRSVRNAVSRLGYEIVEAKTWQDVANADKLLFPGVGAMGQAREALRASGLDKPLVDYVSAGRPFLGICIGMQVLFEGSEENGGCEGLGVLPGAVRLLRPRGRLPVPHIGWEKVAVHDAPGSSPSLLRALDGREVYFVHSYAAEAAADAASRPSWQVATCDYGGDFLAAVRLGEAYATQFHPEKSGEAGLALLEAFLSSGGDAGKRAADAGKTFDFSAAAFEAAKKREGEAEASTSSSSSSSSSDAPAIAPYARRIIACLDVRANDAGKLVVTKGDQYDVREPGSSSGGPSGDVKNLGDPVELAARYFEEGADEVAFLNITAFRGTPLGDVPTLDLLERASARVFVPLTIGGGIRAYTDDAGREVSALEVAGAYFRAGADKVSIGSDAVYAAEHLRAQGGVPDGTSAIEAISTHYGAQAVVVSVDPRRVYVADPADAGGHVVVETDEPGPNGERYAWYQCTVKGGREGRDVDAVQLAQAAETLGAGEILLNCIDKDGAKSGFDIPLVKAVADAVTVPVIASSGAGAPEHFAEVFERTGAAAALAAGIFHRRTVSIGQAKQAVKDAGVPVRIA